MGTLHVQVWTEGRTFVSADPPGFSYSAADERVVWEFSGRPSGASVSVTLSAAPMPQPRPRPTPGPPPPPPPPPPPHHHRGAFECWSCSCGLGSSSETKIKPSYFPTGKGTEAACEQACHANPQCLSFDVQLGGACWLYAVTATKHNPEPGSRCCVSQ